MATSGGPVSFSGSFFNDGATQYLEATTLCNAGSCGQTSTERTHFGLVYSLPDKTSLLSASPARSIPVLLRAETLDAAMAPEQARAELTATMQSFLSAVDVAELTRPYR
jgi:exosortase J